MQTVTLEAESRELLSRGKLSALRKQGSIPAIIYGGDKKSAKGQSLVQVNEKALLKMLQKEGASVLLELKVGSEKTNAVIKELQRNYITRKLIHVDFLRVDMTKKLEVSVHIHLQGEAVGVKIGGGILEHITREIRVSCLPKDIPHEINVDISKLDIGHGITVKDIPVIDGVDVLTDPHQLVANVVAPTILEEVTPEAAATAGAAEPEVILKGKKPEEGEEGAAAPAGGKGAPAAGKAAAPAKGSPTK